LQLFNIKSSRLKRFKYQLLFASVSDYNLTLRPVVRLKRWVFSFNDLRCGTTSRSAVVIDGHSLISIDYDSIKQFSLTIQFCVYTANDYFNLRTNKLENKFKCQ